jgi:hypothetical protein
MVSVFVNASPLTKGRAESRSTLFIGTYQLNSPSNKGMVVKDTKGWEFTINFI